MNPTRFPTRVSHLVLGEYYAIEGRTVRHDMIPAQVFLLERLSPTATQGRTCLEGRLLWAVCIDGLWTDNWPGDAGGMIGHMVGLVEPGVNLTGKHDLHLRRLESPAEFKAALGAGVAYGEYMRAHPVVLA